MFMDIKVEDQTLQNRIFFFLLVCICCAASILSVADAEQTSLYQSVDKALKYSPHLLALNHQHDAVTSDLKRAFNRYYPSIDLELGYGLEQYSDSITRREGASPDNKDWDPLTDASLRLTQKIYDGGETRGLISIQQALLDASSYQIQVAKQEIALDAIMAHLEVYRQRELLALAEKNLKFYQDTFQSLSEMEKTGAGNIADVTQTQARMARAKSTVIMTRADLRRATANYTRATGTKPEGLAFAQIPATLPDTLDEALIKMEKKNPELLLYTARVMEANARLELTYSSYRPKVNLELSSRYLDQYEGDTSWQNTNDAMVVLRWNLFDGGQKKETKNAALSRKYERRSNWDDKLIELQEMTSNAWTDFLFLQSQKKVFKEAKDFSKKTVDYYVKQFTYSKRSLLDVLSANTEYFLAARQLTDIDVNLIVSAHRILMLTGDLSAVD